MRDDMFKVIVERPRCGRAWAVKSKARYDRLPERSHVTGRRLALEVGSTKGLNENLAPLKRYLHKQVGRPWDKVFSEICATLDTGSTVKQHVREHIEDFIMVKVGVAADGSFYGSGHWGGKPLAPPMWWQELYVDPKDGLIKRTDKLCRKLRVPNQRDHWRERAKARWQAEWTHPDLIRRDGGQRFLAKLKGCWFEIETDRPPCLNAPDLIAAFASTQIGEAAAKWQIVSKRQLSKKALKAEGLSNG